MNIKDNMSPWFKATDYQPAGVGAYECRSILPPGTQLSLSGGTFFRWWNGTEWSFPIESDLDNEFAAPPAELYPIHPTTELMPFEWRGFSEDQNPL